jgi:hypothetical protein
MSGTLHVYVGPCIYVDKPYDVTLARAKAYEDRLDGKLLLRASGNQETEFFLIPSVEFYAPRQMIWEQTADYTPFLFGIRKQSEEEMAFQRLVAQEEKPDFEYAFLYGVIPFYL